MDAAGRDGGADELAGKPATSAPEDCFGAPPERTARRRLGTPHRYYIGQSRRGFASERPGGGRRPRDWSFVVKV